MKQARNVGFKKGIQFAVTAALLALAQSVQAANVMVRVVDANTLEPVSGAAVCLGSEFASNAYGAKRTNAAGEVVYAKAPRDNFILSVSGQGQGDYVRSLVPRAFDIIYYVELRQGADSSRCLAPVIQDKQGGKEALSLTSVDVRTHSHNGGTVDISTRVAGLAPTHIRASTNSNFKGARWLPYRNITRHPIERVESENLYVQVKRLVGSKDKTVEAVSTARIGDLHWH